MSYWCGVDEIDEDMRPANSNQFDIDAAASPVEAVLTDGRWLVRLADGRWTTDARRWSSAYLERHRPASLTACG